MKKSGAIILVLALTLMPFVSADIGLSETAVSNLIIKEIPEPAKFEITVKNNNDYADSYIIDSLFDLEIRPAAEVAVPAKAEKTVTKEIVMGKDLRDRQKGYFSFEYYAKGLKEIKKSFMTVKIVSLSDIITIDAPKTIKDTDKTIKVNVKLSEPVEFSTSMVMTGDVFEDYSKDFILTNAGVEIEIPLKDVKPNAGVYTIRAKFKISGYEFTSSDDTVLESIIDINEDVKEYGTFMHRTIFTTKENTGNSVTSTTITVNKPVISGMFTSFNMEPTKITRTGNNVMYEFTKEINPGEKFEIKAVTSYYLPLFIIILATVASVILINILTPKIKIDKKAVRVKTKSGVFATKIVINARNVGPEVTDLKIIERLPAFTELLPERFGTVSPSEIKKRGLIWAIDKLSTNEEVMFSYIVYSKVNILGKLEIPATLATFKDIKSHPREVRSNRLFVLTSEATEPVAAEVTEFTSATADKI